MAPKSLQQRPHRSYAESFLRMALRGDLPPCARAGILFTPQLEIDYGDQGRYELAWTLVLLLHDGTVRIQQLPGDGTLLRPASGRWEILPNDRMPDDDPRLQIRLSLRNIDLGYSDDLYNFDLQPVTDLRSRVGQWQLTWPGGIDGVGIMMDYARGVMWIPVQLQADAWLPVH